MLVKALLNVLIMEVHGCGDSVYILRPLDDEVSCICGWIGDYSNMLFMKKVSFRCKERLRKV